MNKNGRREKKLVTLKNNKSNKKESTEKNPPFKFCWFVPKYASSRENILQQMETVKI